MALFQITVRKTWHIKHWHSIRCICHTGMSHLGINIRYWMLFLQNLLLCLIPDPATLKFKFLRR